MKESNEQIRRELGFLFPIEPNNIGDMRFSISHKVGINETYWLNPWGVAMPFGSLPTSAQSSSAIKG